MALQDVLDIVQDTALTPLVGEACAASILKLDLAQTKCFKILLSKVLGIGIVAGGAIVKIPQLLKIVNAGNAKGVSFTSYLLETLAMAIGLSYNFREGNPFSTYGESAFIAVSNFFILILILTYSKQFGGLGLFVLGSAALTYSLYEQSVITNEILKTLQWGTIFITVASKLPQVISNFAAGSTGQLSAVTVFLTFIGSAARIYTTLQEVDDPVILYSILAASTLNGIIALQVVLYWGKVGVRMRVSRWRVAFTSAPSPFTCSTHSLVSVIPRCHHRAPRRSRPRRNKLRLAIVLGCRCCPGSFTEYNDLVPHGTLCWAEMLLIGFTGMVSAAILWPDCQRLGT
ncbi:putative monosaccharide-P-dolichol utilization protein [Polychytrium aggregatum]|uniref:putative monosaccharide-P-dolichol utilization protein n=1 Tax=Polychytrium aggregatum TaxID=110093 RepID=UPI0022FF3593|nr:putative monosaccharide-P-dolichol utilization protein [Polychytrium aggregatum]KAI9207936.1 putative monosaccharide-P-dolichol utilization protein [Polychytrium aggregatum]